MKIVKRYFLFYCAVGSFFGIYSYIFDLIFCKIDYGQNCHYDYPLSFIFYTLTLLVYNILFTLPICLIYNIYVNIFWKREDNKILRYTIAVLIGLFIGYSVKRFGWSFYIGDYRHLKNIIVFSLTGLSVEILRTIVVRRRLRILNEE